MSKHLFRLMAMVDPNGQAWPDILEEDREAIRWILDAFEKVKAERDEAYKMHSKRLHEIAKSRHDLVDLHQKMAAALNEM